MKIRHLLVVAAAAVAVADASAFKWEPVSLFPSPISEVTSTYFVENLSFECYDAEGLQITDVMPVWVNDEDGKEIKATWGVQDDWNPNRFNYHFNLSDFNGNGDYILVLPEGMLVNGAGDKSDKVERYYTFVVPELAGPMFEDFQVNSVYPDFSQPQGIWENQSVKIDTNHNDAIGYTELILFDHTTGESHTSSNFTVKRSLGNPSAISWEVVGSFKFYEDHEYSAEFVFYNGTDNVSDGNPTPIVGRKTYEFTGKVVGYKYSKLELWDVMPIPSSLISEPSQAVFTYTFSGPVNVYKVSTPRGNAGDPVVYPSSCISSNSEKNVWTIDLSKDEYVNSIDAQLTLLVYARDLDGYQLKGNSGEEDQACFENNWQCELGALPLVVVTPKDGENISRLTEVVVKAENGEPITWSYNGQAYVENSLGIIVGELVIPDDLEGSATEVHFTQWYTDDSPFEPVPIDLSADGAYTIKISSGAFNFGEQFDEHKSHSVESKFSIGNQQLQYASVDPENGSTVKKLDQIIMKFSEPVICDNFQVDVCSASRSVITTATVRPDNMEPTWIIVDFANPVTEAGNYYLVVPDGKIQSETQTNSAFTLTYIVDPQAGDHPGIDPSDQATLNYSSASPASGSTVTELNKVSLIFPEKVTTLDDMAWVRNAKDEAVTTASVNYDWDNEYLIEVELATPIKENGEYVVVILPETICSISYADSDGKMGVYNPEIRLTYIVDNGTTGVVSVEDAVNCDVYDVQGRRVLSNASSADIKTLSKGIYVVDGKKLVVK